MRKVILVSVLIFAVGAGVAWSVFQLRQHPDSVPVKHNQTVPRTVASDDQPETSRPAESEIKDVLLSVPFTVQAPSAQWDNPLFQDGCEEAAIIMAAAWLNGRTLTKQSVEQEIRALAQRQKTMFGQAVDTSAADTAQLMRKYYGYERVTARSNISIDDIKIELAKGNLVIVPADGRRLKNPYYKAPGPERHMLVVIGYDTMSKQFITNDPGTRRGQEYRYLEEILADALRDYLTGNKKPIREFVRSMIVVESVDFGL